MAGCSWVKYFWPPPDDDNTFGSAPEPPTVSNVSHSTLNYWTFYIILPFAKPTVARPKVAGKSGRRWAIPNIYHSLLAPTESWDRKPTSARANFRNIKFPSLFLHLSSQHILLTLSCSQQLRILPCCVHGDVLLLTPSWLPAMLLWLMDALLFHVLAD